jgi:hypothetical protein
MPDFLRATCLCFTLVTFAGLGVAQQPTPTPTPDAQPSPQQTTDPGAQQTPTPVPPSESTHPDAAPEQGGKAQPSPSPTPIPSPLQSEQDIQKKEQSQRILGVVPQFSVTSRQNAPPLTPSQKFRLFVKSSTDPFVFAAAGAQAGIGQATDEFPEYGQGGSGYAKRFGAALADSTSSNFFSNYAYPVLFKEDPRYFRLGQGSIKRRIFYSLEQEFVVRTDSGKRRFSYSNVLGAFTAGGISNLYYPASDRGFGLTLSRSAIALGYGSLGGLIDEFWADIDQKLFHKPKKEAPAPAAAPPTPQVPPPPNN